MMETIQNNAHQARPAVGRINKESTGLMQKCIYLVPQHPQLELIEGLRAQFDPAAQLIPAHITLVFPFTSAVSDLYFIDLMNEVVSQFDPIEFALGQLVCVDSYGFLPITKGRRLITELHDRLYGGELKPFLAGEYPYIPHITIGRYNNAEERERLRQASEQAQILKEGVVEEMCLEVISQEGPAWIQHQARLRQPRTSDLEWLRTL